MPQAVGSAAMRRAEGQAAKDSQGEARAGKGRREGPSETREERKEEREGGQGVPNVPDEE